MAPVADVDSSLKRATLALCDQLLKSLSNPRPLAFIVVVEDHEEIPPALSPHPFDPSLQVVVTVIGPTQPHVAPIRMRLLEGFEVTFAVDDTWGRTMIAKQPQNLIVE